MPWIHFCTKKAASVWEQVAHQMPWTLPWTLQCNLSTGCIIRQIEDMWKATTLEDPLDYCLE
jgi:hypothetical protein